MKKILITIAFFTLIFSSCKVSQLESYQDDIYASPSEEKRLAKLVADEQAKKSAEEKQLQQEAALAQKAKDDANPYYQDPQFNSDDYYDYKYASSISRFHNPVMGAGYYDNFYTNSYMYNQNPNMWGSSIYSSYGWMPSNQFNNFNTGFGLTFGNTNCWSCQNNGWGYNNGWNNGWGYNNGWNNGWGYNNGWNNGWGYNNGWNNGWGNNNGGWGYYNSFDVNSAYSKAEYGPRGSNGGGNSSRQTSAGMLVPEENGSRMQFINEVVAKQESTQKFTDVPRKVLNNSANQNFSGGQINSSEPVKTRNSSSSNNFPNNTNTNINNSPKNEDGFWPKVLNSNQNSGPVKTTNSSSDSPRNENSKPEKIRSSQFENNNNMNFERSNNSGNSNNGGGSSSPRNNGGGGSTRPR
jgi:hypothetical protein